jgi:DNA-binding MarR family transcriptional regulator
MLELELLKGLVEVGGATATELAQKTRRLDEDIEGQLTALRDRGYLAARTTSGRFDNRIYFLTPAGRNALP